MKLNVGDKVIHNCKCTMPECQEMKGKVFRIIEIFPDHIVIDTPKLGRWTLESGDYLKVNSTKIRERLGIK